MELTTITQRLLACIGDPSRYRLLVRLAEQRLCVSELAGAVGLSQSCTTRHLQALSAVGLVRPAREGKKVVYALRDDDPEVERLIHWMRGPSEPSGSKPVTRPTANQGPNRTSRARRPRPIAAAPTDGPGASLTEPVPSGDGAGELDEAGIQRPPRAADLEDFLL